jgi:O-antigen/teichoic acid export membrane protein
VSAADQVLSGLSNVIFAVAVARFGTPTEFGVLSAGLVALTALLSIARTGLGNAVTMAARTDDTAVRSMAAHALAFLICLAPLAAAFVVSVAWVAGASQAWTVGLLLAVATPIVLAQDLLRYLASALGRPVWALVADTTWLLVMGLIIAGSSLLRISLGLGPVAVGWIVGAAVALVMLALALRAVPHFRELRAWAAAQGGFLLHAMGGTAAVSSANVGRVSMIGAARGPVAVGSLSAGQLIMTPLNVVAALIPFAVTPVIARRSGAASASRAYALVAAGSTLVGLAWWAICAMVPEDLGSAVLGEMWGPAISLVAPMALLSIGVLLNVSAQSLLLFMGRTRSYGAVSLTLAALSLIGTVMTLHLGGAVRELAWAQTAAVLMAAALGWALALTNPGQGRRVAAPGG